MRKGGYTIINLKDTDFTLDTAVTVRGIYERVEGSYRKPILISGLTIGGVEQADVYAQVTVDGTSIVLTTPVHTITVTDEDVITVKKIN